MLVFLPTEIKFFDMVEEKYIYIELFKSICKPVELDEV